MRLRQNDFERPHYWDGRKAGFELEFCGIDLRDCAKIIHSLCGGSIEWRHRYKADIKNSRIGDIKLELDYRGIQEFDKKVQKDYHHTSYLSLFLNQISKLAGFFIKGIVPLEIATSPLKFEQFKEVDLIREKLRLAKAVGTKQSLINAFGLHINPEAPSLKPDLILDYIRAFLLFYPWLKQELETDFSRRALSFIDNFPEDYQNLVMRQDYRPSQKELIDDYLRYNPTRNRPLDMLPLFLYIDPLIAERFPKNERSLIKPRPAFHYRLPNCEIDSENWRVAHEWNSWCLVENLAWDKKKLERLASAYLVSRSNWPEIIEKELQACARSF